MIVRQMQHNQCFVESKSNPGEMQLWRSIVLEVRKHAIISGTGRAGTSFLVDFLRSVGVPTAGIAEEPEHRIARAGLERNLLSAEDSYLVKDPWLHEYIDQVDLEIIEIEALIIPMRDLSEAASSRIRIERAALLQFEESRAQWSSIGLTPGGVLASLSISDQERLLAVGLAWLVQWAVKNEIPLYLLDYPRIVEDPVYLVESLSPWLEKFAPKASSIDLARKKANPRTWANQAQDRVDFVPRENFLNLESQLGGARLVIADQQVELLTLREELEILSGENRGLREELETLTENVLSLLNEVDAIRRSKSFQIGKNLAAPLRLVMRRRS